MVSPCQKEPSDHLHWFEPAECHLTRTPRGDIIVNEMLSDFSGRPNGNQYIAQPVFEQSPARSEMPMFTRFSFPRLHRFSVLLCLAPLAPAFATDSVTYTGSVVRDYQYAQAPAMQMPTSVAVSTDGTVAVADGVNHRILLFPSAGGSAQIIDTIGEERLTDPLNMRFDSAGRLWIADTGQKRVVVRAVDGSLDRIITLDAPADGHPFNPTGVIPIGDGQQAWIVDNDSHRILRWDARTQPADFITLGKQGSALGQFYYPFMAALDSEGRLYVTDALNGRVQSISSAGRAVGIISSYGVEPGQLYRPKGVAVDADGHIWVSDSVTGVVQVFERTGAFLGVLRDAADRPMKFAAPMGLAFGPDGNLFVTESLADRVREVKIATQPRPRELPRPGRARVVPGAGQAPACTICHIEWLPALADNASTPIMSLPEHGPDHPVVSQSDMCYSCHDGSVVDSRRRVWREHGHRTGIVPPAGMTVPKALPLVDGKIACRTCHSAHAGGQQNQSLADVVFVRVERGAGELCISCHGDKAMGPAAGAHPVGGMPWPVPEELIKEGAKVGTNPRELTCYVCHMPHGSQEHHLLVMGTESSQLCLTCHAKLRPGLWRPDLPREHPQNPPLQTPAQKEAIRDMGTSVGADDTLICLSCHKIHHGVSDRYLLADTLQDSRLCIRCHPERAEMKGTPHDLRVSAPDCRNRIGQTAEQSGPCGACHTFHRYARMPDPQPHDPTGLCTTCHQADSCASKVDFTAPGHPYNVSADQLPDNVSLHVFPRPDGQGKVIACLTCHNPHQATNRFFLNKPQPQLCAECHTGMATSMSGGHELIGLDARNIDGRTPAEAGKCGFCHTMHEAKGPALWAATADPPQTADGLCTNCHRQDGLAARLPESKLRHPTGPETVEAAARLTTDLPLKDGQVSCSSCHDPHGDAKAAPALLRDGPKTANLCVDCHREPAGLAHGYHDITRRPDAWPAPSRDQADVCMSCHQVHSNDEARGLWTMTPAKDYAQSDGVCLSCHTHVEWSGHGVRPAEPGPQTQPAERTQEPSIHGLPLVPTAPGRRSGTIGCKTCHDPHGAPGEPHLLRATATHDPGAMCLACHQDLQYIGLSMHGHEMMKEFTQGTQAPQTRMLQCGPCHSVHTPEPAATQPLPGVLGQLPQDVQRCVSCHRPGGGATPVKIIEHFGPLQNVSEPGTPGFMPLVNDAGQIGREGRIGCITCHAPHGRPPGPAFPAVDPKQITREQLQAMMPMVSPYNPPNLCSSCHGFDGLMRYLYWHQPERRGGAER